MTNTLRTIVLIAATALLTVLLLHGQRESTQGQIGRFQIVSVVVASVNEAGNELRAPAISKIDTTTGECSRYLMGTSAIQNADGSKGRISHMGWYSVERPNQVIK